MADKLSQKELHHFFLEDIKDYVCFVKDNGKKPLEFHLEYPFNRDVKAYIYNCTAPGGRTIDEYKVQLILDGQKRGQRGKFDDSDGKTDLIIGYANPFVNKDEGVWVLFELEKHREFAYSANIQIYLRQILKTLEQDVYVHQKHNKETVVLSQRKYLGKALQERFDIDLQIMIGKAENGIKDS